MGSAEQPATGQKQEYLTKKVNLNGHLVTLYSLNGHTWLSSPEEIPEVMARLENARVTLTPEQQGDAEAAEGDKEKGAERVAGKKASEKPGDKKAADAKANEKGNAPQAPAVQLASKYRLKGPKPRPILRQNGMVFKGTPVETFSASEVQVKAAEGKAQQKAAKGAKAKAKLKAPVLAEARAAAKAVAAAAKLKGKKAAQPVAQKVAKGKQPAVAAKVAKTAALAKVPAKSAKVPAKTAQPIKKPNAAKPKAKAAKPAAKKAKASVRRKAR